jgi:hypothetical protein
MGDYRQYLAYQAFFPAAQLYYLSDFHTGHGQPMGQLLNRPINVYVVAKPA